MTSFMINLPTPSFETEMSVMLELGQSVQYTYLKVLNHVKPDILTRFVKFRYACLPVCPFVCKEQFGSRWTDLRKML